MNFYRYVSDNPINLTDPMGLHDYTEQETLAQLQQAYADATAGRIEGLENIYNHSKGWETTISHICQNIKVTLGPGAE